MRFPVSDDNELDFVMRDAACLGGGQDVYAFGYALDDGLIELYYPSVYECSDVKISDSYCRIMPKEALDSKIATGQFVEIEGADALAYDARGFYQPELFDAVYAGRNPEIIHHIEKMRELLGDKYDTRVAEKDEDAADLMDAIAEAKGAARQDEVNSKTLYEGQLAMTPDGPVVEGVPLEQELGNDEIDLKEFLECANSLGKEDTARDGDVLAKDAPVGHDEL